MLVVLWALALRGASCCGQQVTPQVPHATQGTAGVLVLQDGGVLSGTFSRAGDRYVLTRGGTELQIAATRVLVACRSLEEAYDERRKQIQQPTAEPHLVLAEWCLRYNLLSQAAREIVDARGLEPHNRRLALLERRLAAAGSPRPKRDPLVDGDVKPAAHGGMEPSDAAIRPAAIAIDDLSPGSIERFTRRVQPILVNNCTISGCHQRGGQQSFQLDRALLHGLANRRSTMQNLAATLTLVDREQPHLSRLLSVPRQSHGGMRSPTIGPRQSVAYAHLVDWVALVTKTDSPEEQSKSPTPGNDEFVAADGTESRASDQTRTIEFADNVRSASFDALPEQGPGRRSAGREIRFGARLESWQPKDPFDPEAFNRLQHRRRSQGTEGAVLHHVGS